MIKFVSLLLLMCNLCVSQISLYGLDGWYHSNTLATAGGAGAVPNTNSDRINPAGVAALPNQIQFNIIKYPAGINAQSAVYVNELKQSSIGIGIRHLNYGNFASTNENGVESGNYSAEDTWLSTTWARENKNISIGITGGVFLSNLESFNATAITLSAGILYNHPNYDTRLGVSLSNIGIFFNRYTEQKAKLPTKIFLSANKGLKYLPLDINVDIGVSPYNENIYWRIGGIFKLPYNLQMSFGVNSNNIDQRIEKNRAKSMFGSSGIGIVYEYKRYLIEIGGYSYGTGGWIYGTGFSLKI